MDFEIAGLGRRSFDPRELVIAGWAGRDAAAIEHHIRELEAIGVKRPRATPTFYRLAASLLSTAGRIEVAGTTSSGEAEAVLLAFDDGLYVGVGSDHTDRAVETYGVTVSKQVCAKPVGRDLWPLADVADHWDRLELTAHVRDGGARKLYQQGTLSSLRDPDDLLARYRAGGGAFAPGAAMFCGTMPVHGGFCYAPRVELALHDPVCGRTLSHAYDVAMLDIAD